jgi:hypothetical protein
LTDTAVGYLYVVAGSPGVIALQIGPDTLSLLLAARSASRSSRPRLRSSPSCPATPPRAVSQSPVDRF